MQRSFFFICPFFLLACHPDATSPSGAGTVQLSVIAPESTRVQFYEGYSGYGRHQKLLPGREICARSPCETQVPPGSTFVFWSPNFPTAIAKMPLRGDTEAHVVVGSKGWQSVAPWTALAGVTFAAGGGLVLGDGFSRRASASEIAVGGTVLALGLGLAVASLRLLTTTGTKVRFEPLTIVGF